MTSQPTNVTIEHPISQALTYTKRIFSPFDASKWLGLAFCAFLANCSNGGGGGGGNVLNRFDSLDNGMGFEEYLVSSLRSLIEMGPLVFVAIGAVVVIVILLRVLMIWLGSRGDFMFMDGILHNRGNVVEPWERFRGLAHSLFLTRVSVDVFTWFGLGIFGVLIAIGAFTMSTSPALGGLTMLLASLVLLVPGLIAIGLTHFIIDTLVIPAMYKSGKPASEVWPMVKSELISGHWGDLSLYGLVRVGLHIGVGIATIIVTLCTCCVPVIPYIGTVALLPFIAFMRSHQLAFYEELTGSPMI
jgi:hypothetical protein